VSPESGFQHQPDRGSAAVWSAGLVSVPWQAWGMAADGGRRGYVWMTIATTMKIRFDPSNCAGLNYVLCTARG
jgi:hypothetical protein